MFGVSVLPGFIRVACFIYVVRCGSLGMCVLSHLSVMYVWFVAVLLFVVSVFRIVYCVCCACFVRLLVSPGMFVVCMCVCLFMLRVCVCFVCGACVYGWLVCQLHCFPFFRALKLHIRVSHWRTGGQGSGS